MSHNPPVRYGFRHEILHNKQGSPFNRDTPLAAEDFLDPQPGDVFFHGELHDQELDRLLKMLDALVRPKLTLTVLSQVKLILPAPSRLHPMPDILIVENLPSPNRPRTRLDMAADGILPACVVEITSPNLAQADLETKPPLYAAAGIPELIILDTGLRPDQTTPTPSILAYRLANGHYAPQLRSEDGSVFVQALDARLTTHDERFYFIDPKSGERLDVSTQDNVSLSSTQAEGRFRGQSIASQLKL